MSFSFIAINVLFPPRRCLVDVISITSRTLTRLAVDDDDDDDSVEDHNHD